uniref:Uncharacterized protein n=1 Tax=Anopheles merus TaxID=30066 RepID=A0A182VID0_ANOME
MRRKQLYHGVSSSINIGSKRNRKRSGNFYHDERTDKGNGHREPHLTTRTAVVRCRQAQLTGSDHVGAAVAQSY